MCVKKILCGNGFTIFVQVSKENFHNEEQHKYSKLINKHDDKQPQTSNEQRLITAQEENVIITTNK